MRKLSFLFSILAIAIVGCQNNHENLTLQDEADITLTASIENGTDSRTALNNELKVIWSEGDLISAFLGESTNSEFVLSKGKGTTYGEFVARSLNAGTESNSSKPATSLSAYVAYYPYAENVTISTDEDKYEISAVFPTNQTYGANGSFGNDASPMMAVTKNTFDTNLMFKNVGSLFRLQLKGTAKITRLVLESTSGIKIAGNYIVTASNTDLPSVKMADDAVSSITLTCPQGGVQLNESSATIFAFALVPTNFPANDLRINVYDSDGGYMTYVYAEALDLKRSKSKKPECVDYLATGKAPLNVDDANDALQNGATDVKVSITNDDNEPTFKLPEQVGGNEPTNLSFENIPDGVTIVLTASTESNGNEAKEVNVTVPENTGKGYNLNIDLPNSTVGLNVASGETAIYDVVTSLTAQNTLVVENGVTIKSLIVRGGNVSVKNGAKIETITNVSGMVINLIVEDGAIIPATIPNNVKIVRNGSNIEDWESDGEF